MAKKDEVYRSSPGKKSYKYERDQLSMTLKNLLDVMRLNLLVSVITVILLLGIFIIFLTHFV